MMEKIAADTVPPLPAHTNFRPAIPEALSIESRFGIVPVPSNPWQILPSTVFIDARVVRPLKPLREVRIGQTCVRSLFRRGKMTLDADGFTLSGMGIAPIRWLKPVSWIGAILFPFAMSGAMQLTGVWQEALVDLSVIWLCLCLLLICFEPFINEWRRVPLDTRIPWSKVSEMQSHSSLQWAILVYGEPPAKPGGRERQVFLPINSLTPGVLGALQDAVDAYAPGKSRHAVDRETWTRGKLIVIGILLTIIMVAVVIAIQSLIH